MAHLKQSLFTLALADERRQTDNISLRTRIVPPFVNHPFYKCLDAWSHDCGTIFVVPKLGSVVHAGKRGGALTKHASARLTENYLFMQRLSSTKTSSCKMELADSIHRPSHQRPSVHPVLNLQQTSAIVRCSVSCAIKRFRQS
jgi:hypothetical protein